MLDMKRIRQNPEEVLAALKARGKDFSLDTLLEQDEQRRKLLVQAEEKKALRNAESKKIGAAKKSGASQAEMNAIMEAMRAIGDEIAAIDMQIAELDAAMESVMLKLPNLPHTSVPTGTDEHDNVEVRRWGTPRRFLWEPKPHWDIGMDLKILDWDSAAKLSGSHFTVYRGLGARLERAVSNFFLNTHIENGYDEVYLPYMVARDAMTGTGQLPSLWRRPPR